MKDLRADRLNRLYTELAKPGQNKRTGARRGEILGLKWTAVDFVGNRVHICNNILYSPDIGIYEDTPKTATSDRWVSLPTETMQLLRKYQVWQNMERLRLGDTIKTGAICLHGIMETPCIRISIYAICAVLPYICNG